LHQELTKRVPGFEHVNYVDDEGDAIRMTTDEELHLAIILSKGVLKLVLNAPPRKGPRCGNGKPEVRIRKWLQREEPERADEWEQKLLSLNELGFYRIRHNLQALRAQGGCEDLQKTIEILKTKQGEQEERLKRRDLKKLERGLKRKHNDENKKDKKAKKPRCGEKRKKERSVGNANAESAQDFLALANQAFIDLTGVTLTDKFTHLFVDGNNMLYLTNKLRSYTLQRKIHISQKLLAAVARQFSVLNRFVTELVFDSISRSDSSAGLEHFENGSTFLVTSAHPEFPTSDAKFVAWARAHPEAAPRTLVVTSDRALAGELFTLGVSVVKPGTWLTCLVKSASPPSEGNSVDWKEWLDAFIDRVIDE